MSGEPISHRIFIERLVIALIVVGIALLLWNLRDLFLLVFGSVLVSVILGLVAQPIRDRLGVPRWVALLAAVLIVVGVIGIAFWTVRRRGDPAGAGAEGDDPGRLAGAAGAARRLGASATRSANGRPASAPKRGMVANIGSLAVTVGSGIADTFLVIVGGIYLAAQPDLYWIGMLKLVPKRGARARRRRARGERAGAAALAARPAGVDGRGRRA